LHSTAKKLLRKARHFVCKSVSRLAGELSIVRVLNDFQPLPIYVFISEQTTRQQTPRYLSASPEQKF
ncbi:hypothetical protein HI154_RS11795, partial [Escherichia coli]